MKHARRLGGTPQDAFATVHCQHGFKLEVDSSVGRPLQTTNRNFIVPNKIAAKSSLSPQGPSRRRSSRPSLQIILCNGRRSCNSSPPAILVSSVPTPPRTAISPILTPPLNRMITSLVVMRTGNTQPTSTCLSNAFHQASSSPLSTV